VHEVLPTLLVVHSDVYKVLENVLAGLFAGKSFGGHKFSCHSCQACDDYAEGHAACSTVEHRPLIGWANVSL